MFYPLCLTKRVVCDIINNELVCVAVFENFHAKTYKENYAYE